MNENYYSKEEVSLLIFKEINENLKVFQGQAVNQQLIYEIKLEIEKTLFRYFSFNFLHKIPKLNLDWNISTVSLEVTSDPNLIDCCNPVAKKDWIP